MINAAAYCQFNKVEGRISMGFFFFCETLLSSSAHALLSFLFKLDFMCHAIVESDEFYLQKINLQQ